jgi:thioredoxin reductase
VATPVVATPGAAAPEYDAIVVGSGPNGLAAAITLQESGLSVLLIEGKDTLGGGTDTPRLPTRHLLGYSSNGVNVSFFRKAAARGFRIDVRSADP